MIEITKILSTFEKIIFIKNYLGAIKDGVYLENSKNVNQSQEAEVNTVIVNSVSPVVNNPTDEEKLEKIESTPVKQASPEIFDDLPTEKHPLEEEQGMKNI